jgi:ubiquitin carboxyl-terminal hydrolase 7
MLGLATVALTVAASDVPPYAGLQNQGNTCYMNSLLQSLCHVPGFARAVYELPAPLPPLPDSESGSESGSTGTSCAAAGTGASPPPTGSADSGSDATAEDLAIAHEMQRLLYQLGRAPSLGEVYVGTQRLTRALGMSPRDVLIQQDAQEFWQRLYAALAAVGRRRRRKGAPPPAPTKLGGLFQGTTLNYVRCTRVPFRSERQGRFCDLQLQVAGCSSLGASLRRFTAEETLEGEYNTKDER